MSLARTIDRLARIVRAEARRNPAFAARLEAALAAHVTRRADLEAVDIDAIDALEEPALPAAAPLAQSPSSLNPIGLVSREGPGALAAVLSQPEWDKPALLALALEHNLDPAGEADALEAAQIVARLVEQARRRVERDRKLFDY